MKTFKRLTDILENVELLICQGLVIVLILVVFLQVLARYVLHWEVIWTLEAAIFCFVWTIMLGAAIGVKRGIHYTIDVLPSGHWLIRTFYYSGVLVLSLIFAYHGALLAASEWKRFSQPSMVRITFFISCIPAMGISSAIFIVEKILNDLLGTENSEERDT